jgi:hypothetical protein
MSMNRHILFIFNLFGAILVANGCPNLYLHKTHEQNSGR